MKGAVTVVIPNRNCNRLEGDITEELEGFYKVRIRGSQASQKGDHDEVLIAKEPDLIQHMRNPKEWLREGLIKAKRKNRIRQDLKKRWVAICIDDEIGYLIDFHTDPKTLDGMPEKIENQVLARVVASYYLGDGTTAYSGGTLTSYARALSPFAKVFVDNGKALVSTNGG